MKVALFAILFAFIASLSAYAGDECKECEDKPLPPVAERFEKVIIVPKGSDVACPATYQTSMCTSCHTNDWGLKEIDPHLKYTYPNIDTKIIDGIGHFKIDGPISGFHPDGFSEALEYFKRHDITHVVVLIDSPGGSLFSSWLVVGLMEEAKRDGVIIETRCYSMAMSGAFMIFAAGSDGYRLGSPTAEWMWHELISFEMFSIQSPSDKEEQARVLRHLQNTINSWIATRLDKTKDEVDSLVHKKEWWLNGIEAKNVGLVDRFTNE